MNRSSRGPAARSVAALALALGLGACVSQSQYDEAVTAADLYMRSYHDAQAHIGELEAENQRLKGELDLSGGPVEASAYITDIDRRIEDLDELLAGLGLEGSGGGATGARGDVTVRAVEGGLAYEVRDSVLFDSGSAEVRPTGRELIARLGQTIAGTTFRQVWVRGHTDGDPVRQPETLRRFPHGNLQLSSARAIEVAALLQDAAGIPARKLGVVGFGSSRPIAPNDSASNKQLNRRVEIVVLDGEGPAGEGFGG